MNGALFLDVGQAQCPKKGERVCGDAFRSRKLPAENRVISVLADGLGSGLKANVLATMTATMGLKFVSADAQILPAAEIMMEALPVCRVRKISYATFTIIDCRMESRTRVIELDNPPFILIRKGEPVDVPHRELVSPKHRDRVLRVSEFEMQPEDRIVAFTDGISQAGLGTDRHHLGWKRAGVAEFLCRRIAAAPTVSAQHLAEQLLREALSQEADGCAGDDMTATVLYFRQPRRLLVLSGPPYDQARDTEYARLIDEFPGRRVICGGTTANIVARILHREIETVIDSGSRTLPAFSRMPGTDLVTEGILTLTRTAQLLEGDLQPGERNAATSLVELFRESDLIEFVVGTRINEAHQDPTLPVDLEIRRNIIRRIAAALRDRLFKEVSVRFI
ncbi:MAG TPA: SpoIIE family protein phosphatase [Candidatus Ozemobacteraceae bacterium]|nr:SpoIIE family protein phosphatase [Candidatus Ozemobacteraceae bacterium]